MKVGSCSDRAGGSPHPQDLRLLDPVQQRGVITILAVGHYRFAEILDLGLGHGCQAPFRAGTPFRLLRASVSNFLVSSIASLIALAGHVRTSVP